jgi:glycosyltransferase involved in cell wall biosynthesis
MNKKKILFLLHLPPPIHGVSQINTIIKESHLINDRYDCEYINLTTANEISEFGKRRFSKYIQVLKLIVWFLAKTITGKFDLIYITPSIPGIGFYKDSIFIFLGKLLRKKIICHLHVQGFHDASLSSLKRKYYSSTFNNTHIVHLSKLLYQDIRNVADEARVFFVANGIKPTSFSELTEDDATDPENLEILFLSNMIEFKGPLLLLEALTELLKTHEVIQNIHVTFIGEWQDALFKDRFFEYVERNNLSSYVDVVGPVYGSKKNKYFRNADVFVLPTNFDAFPLVLLEAMEFSLPIISTEEGAIPDIVDNGKTGFMIEKGDIKSLAEKIYISLSEPELLKQFGRQARVKFENNYTAEVMERNIDNVIDTVIRND